MGWAPAASSKNWRRRTPPRIGANKTQMLHGMVSKKTSYSCMEMTQLAFNIFLLVLGVFTIWTQTVKPVGLFPSYYPPSTSPCFHVSFPRRSNPGWMSRRVKSSIWVRSGVHLTKGGFSHVCVSCFSHLGPSFMPGRLAVTESLAGGLRKFRWPLALQIATWGPSWPHAQEPAQELGQISAQ